MKLKVICVWDAQAQAFNRPLFVPQVGLGLRAIGDEVNRSDPQNPLFAHTQDFRVFELGEWDDATGIFVCHPQPLLLVDCTVLRSQ